MLELIIKTQHIQRRKRPFADNLLTFQRRLDVLILLFAKNPPSSKKRQSSNRVLAANPE